MYPILIIIIDIWFLLASGLFGKFDWIKIEDLS